MHPRSHSTVALAPATVEELRVVALDAGLDALGVARAEPFEGTRADLEARAAEGLDAGMGFTYRNPLRSTSPERLLRNARSLVVGARSYHRHTPDAGDGPAGRVGRYAWEDHYDGLRRGLHAVADRLKLDGARAAVFVDGNHLVDREAAHRAGLGWYGKNTNLLLGERGSWFVLGTVVTDADLPAAEPMADGCGTCRRCLDSCPTGALPRPGVLDANRCLAWLAQKPGPFPRHLRVALHDRIYGCDDCQAVCPPNRREEQRVALRTTAGPADGAWVPLLELLAAGDEAVLDRWGRWYLADRKPFALRRNALIALGNTADPADARVRRALLDALHDTDGLLRATAVWAVRRLGLDELLPPALAADPEPEVRAELAAEAERR